MKAHESLLTATDLLEVISNLRDGQAYSLSTERALSSQQSFVELGGVWQAPLYEITLKFNKNNHCIENEGTFCFHCSRYIQYCFIFCSEKLPDLKILICSLKFKT